MKIVSWNVNGIRAVLRKNELAPFVGSAHPDVICIQETKAQQGEAEIGLAGYSEYWNSAEKKGYSGTAILSKTVPVSTLNGLSPNVMKRFDMTGDVFGDPSTEGRVLTAEFDKLYVVTVYTPNSKDDLSRIPLRRDQWDPGFLAHCKELEKRKPVVFCGDLNVAHTEDDLAHPKSNRGKKGFTDEERAGFQAFVDAGFVDTFRMFTQGNGHYTWWSMMGGGRARNVGWRIDYLLVSESLRDRVKASEIHADVMGSDHCPISIELDI